MVEQRFHTPFIGVRISVVGLRRDLDSRASYGRLLSFYASCNKWMNLLPRTSFLAVERDNYKLRYYRRGLIAGKWKLVKIFDVAIGAVGHATPRGLFQVTGKTRTPDWRMPDSEWVQEEDRGRIVPFFLPDGTENPENPFEGGFISLWDGVGIHGTKFDPSLGSRASHGCVRMATPDFLRLYDEITTGTSVYIF
jgi:hypothetical protein